MSLFSTIFEGVINEVKAEDAYNRFYSSMPKKDFEKITGGEPEIDKFVQFLLNTVRDGLSTVDEAAQANSEFKSADPLVRQNILNAFRAGEYETANEVLVNLQYLKEGGFINKNKFAKQGYIKVAENDEWLVTCTTNYMANNHYFGHTKWCTASDRLGRYDGYLMYKRYGCDGNSLLMQFTRKGTKGETYQAEVDGVPDGGMRVSTICNIEDEQISLEELKNIVGPIVEEVLGDMGKLQTLIRIQKEQKEHEDKYQEKQSKIIREKRRREEERLRRLYEENFNEVERRNVPIKQDYDNKWKNFVATKKYQDIDYLNRLLVAREKIDETDEDEEYVKIVEETDGFLMQDRCGFCFDGSCYRIISFEIGMIMHLWYVKEIYDENGDVLRGYEPAFDKEHFETVSRMFVLTECYDNKITKFITEISHDYGYAYTPRNVESRIPEYNQRFLVNFFHFDNNGTDVVKSYLFDLKEKNAICYEDGGLNWPEDYAPRFVFPFGEDGLVLASYSRDGGCPIGTLILRNDGSFEFLTGSHKFFIDEDRTLLFNKETMMLCRVDREKPLLAKLPNTKNVTDIYRTNDDKRVMVYVSVDMDKENIFDMEKGEYVFGNWCGSCSQNWSEDEFVGVFTDKLGNKLKIKYFKDDDKYFLIKKNREYLDNVPCDKYGATEEDRKKKELSDRNLKAWQDAGGYTPEQKAQMDAMWKSHDGGESDGSEAMKAWNDDDIAVDDRDDRFQYGSFFSRIDPQKDDKNWGKNAWGQNLVGLRDPEDFFRSYEGDDWENPEAYRPGQTYRVGRNGHPLDQEWRDEDEIPARFTDDSLNESIKKVITLMNKLIKD